MSRLFDALKGARGFRQGTEGKADEGVWDALGISETDVLPAMEADQTQTSTSTEWLPEDLASVVSDDEMIEYDPALEAGADATPAQVILDPRARLLPHAADTVIAEYYR